MRYARLNSTLWTGSAKWRKVQAQCPGDYLDPRLLYFYLHTNPHSNAIGCYCFHPAYGQADLRCAEKPFRNGFETLLESSLIAYSEEEGVLFLINSIKQDPPHNINHAKGMMALLGEIPDCHAKELCWIELQECEQVQILMNDPDFINPVKPSRDGFETVSEPSRTPTPTPTPVPVPTPKSMRTCEELPNSKEDKSKANGHNPGPEKLSEIGNAANRLWFDELNLGAGRTYSPIIGAAKLSSLTEHYGDEEILDAIRKIARIPSLRSWLGGKGPAILAEMSRGQKIIDHVVDQKEAEEADPIELPERTPEQQRIWDEARAKVIKLQRRRGVYEG